ncbi:hypothetical protein [Streptomyces sp. NPDC002853]
MPMAGSGPCSASNGYAFACTDCEGDDSDRQEITVCDEANSHWNNTDEILAVGDVDGPLGIDDDGTPDTAGFPDLLVKEGSLLWLYFGAADNRLDTGREPILIGPGGWKDLDLFTPGATNGDGLADQSAKIRTGTNFGSTNIPLITSPGDVDGSGRAFDLWLTRSDNTLLRYQTTS